jgi:hypothetical protein
MEEHKDNRRVRMNFSQTAKGHYQIDCTVEFPSVEECGVNMRKALEEAKAIIKEKGLIEAGTI